MRISGRKPTYEERKFIEKAGLDTYKWLVQKNVLESMQLINRETGEIRTISK